MIVRNIYVVAYEIMLHNGTFFFDAIDLFQRLFQQKCVKYKSILSELPFWKKGHLCLFEALFFPRFFSL